MPDKTVSIVNGVLRVNGMERGRIVKGLPLRDGSRRWILNVELYAYLKPGYGYPMSWPTRKAAAEWVKEKLANR